MQPEVRLAQSRDVNDLIALVREAHAEEPIGPSAKLDDNSVFNTILRAISGQSVIGVIGEPGEIQSSCFLDIAKPWYSQTPIIETFWCYTRPDFRKSTNSKSLMEWVRSQSQRLNIPLQMQVPLSEQNKPRLALCERVLGTPAGFSFRYDPDPDKHESPVTPVEPASLDDEPEVFDTIRELAKENGAYQPDEEMAIPLLRGALNGEGVIGVIRPKDSIEGLIFLTVATPWYSREPFLDEFLCYVKPKYRKSQDAKALVKFATHQADRLNIPLRIGIISKIELARKMQLYTRILGAPATSHFLFRPEVI